MDFKKDNDIMSGKGEWEESEHPRDNDGKFTAKGGGQSTMSQESSEKSETKKESNSLEAEIDSVLNGTNKNSYVKMADETPKIFQEIGVPNKPLMITAKHTYLAINETGKYTGKDDHYHNLGKDLFLAIPKLLQSPALVLQKEGETRDIIAVLNWYDKNKNILICPIRIGGSAKYNEVTIDGNIIKSVYGRENFQRYINKNFKPTDILAVGNKKIRDIHQ